MVIKFKGIILEFSTVTYMYTSIDIYIDLYIRKRGR